MLASFWLAMAGLPVFHQPFAAAPEHPAVIALAAGDVRLQPPCLQLSCMPLEWAVGEEASTYAYRESDQPVRTTLPGAPIPGVRAVKAKAQPRGWSDPYTGLDRVSAQYGRSLVDSPTTGVRVEVGTGYRFQPYTDNGAADTGLIARGQLQLTHKLGERASLSQNTRVEAGRDNTYVRNSLGVDVELRPQWMLRSSLEMRHDTAANGGDGRTDTESNVQLKYAF